jgi:hypothetical protein
VLALSAPSADQILGDKFQLARLITPQTRPALEAPVILATAPATAPDKPLGDNPQASEAKPSGPSSTGEILHRAGLTVAPSGEASRQAQPRQVPPRPEQAEAKQAKPSGETRKAADTIARAPAAEAKPPIRTATRPETRPATAATRPASPTTRSAPTAAGTIDPLAPLAEGDPAGEGSRTDR